MKNDQTTKGIMFLLILFILIVVSSLWNGQMVKMNTYKESYKNMYLNLANQNLGSYPNADNDPILVNSYPTTGSKTVSNNNYSDIWQNYPIFTVGSYAQFTNNLKYWQNPDDGECRTAEFCGALYKDKKVNSNIVTPLPPAPPVNQNSVRVGYYKTDMNLIPGVTLGPDLPAF